LYPFKIFSYSYILKYKRGSKVSKRGKFLNFIFCMIVLGKKRKKEEKKAREFFNKNSLHK